jgi:hypothetical protein
VCEVTFLSRLRLCVPLVPLPLFFTIEYNDMLTPTLYYFISSPPSHIVTPFAMEVPSVEESLSLAPPAKVVFYDHQRLISHTWSIGEQFLLIFGALLFWMIEYSLCESSTINEQIQIFAYVLAGTIFCAFVWIGVEHVTQSLSTSLAGKAVANLVQWSLVCALANFINIVILAFAASGSVNSILISLGLIVVVLLIMAINHFALSAARDRHTADIHRGAFTYGHIPTRSKEEQQAQVQKLIQKEKEKYNKNIGVLELFGLPLVSADNLLYPHATTPPPSHSSSSSSFGVDPARYPLLSTIRPPLPPPLPAFSSSSSQQSQLQLQLQRH